MSPFLLGMPCLADTPFDDSSVDLAIAEEEDAMFDVSQFHDTSFDSSEATSDEDAAIERALLAGGIIRLSSMGQSGSGGRRDIKEKKRVAKGKGKAVVIDDVYIDDDSEDSDEDEMFEGSNTWADNDEDYIRGVQVNLPSCRALIAKLTSLSPSRRLLPPTLTFSSEVETARRARSFSKPCKRATLRTLTSISRTITP